MRVISFAEPILNKKKIIYDTVLVLVLAVIGISAFLITESLREEGAYAVVTVNGEWAGEYPLDKDGEYPLSGGTNLLVIQDGKAFVKDATCPDKLCINQGKISRTGERIVCLPNRVMIEITGEGEQILESK